MSILISISIIVDLAIVNEANQGLESNFCRWIKGRRLAQKERVFDRRWQVSQMRATRRGSRRACFRPESYRRVPSSRKHRSAPKQKCPWYLSLWGPLGDTPPIRNIPFLGPCKAPEGTTTQVTSAKCIFCAYSASACNDNFH